MSHVVLLAYDIALPETITQKGFCIGAGRRVRDFDFVGSVYDMMSTSHEYLHEFYLSVDKWYLEILRDYLLQNVRAGSEICVWHTVLGENMLDAPGDKIPAGNISLHEMHDVYDDVKYFYTQVKEIVPKCRDTSVEALSLDDISFVQNNVNAYLAIKR